MNYLAYAAAAFILVPLVAIVLNNICPKRLVEDNFHLLAGVVAVSQFVSVSVAAYLMNAYQLSEYSFSIISGVSSHLFTINAVSLVFLFCIGLVSLVSVLIAIRTIDAKKSAYVNLLMTLIVSMNGMLLVNDCFSLYVFLDVIGISSFVMIAMFRSRKGLEGSIKYLIMSGLATTFILVALAFIFMGTGSLAYVDVRGIALNDISSLQTVLIHLALVLTIAGLAIKTGVFPFHSWRPDAYQSADASISVLLAGVVSKVAGVYGFIVLISLFPGVRAIRVSLAAIGLVSIVTGALLALRQTHFKRILAYSSVSQMGYILLGLSAGTTLGLVGAILHVFSHATFKSTLFANAAALQEQVGTLEIDALGGLQSRMPVTSFSSVVAFLSTAGIPPFAGFWSKLLIILSLWSAGYQVLAGLALCASVLTAAYFLRLQKKVFFGTTPEHLAMVVEIKGSIRFVQVLLTAITCIVGLFFPLVLVFLQSKGLI